MALAAATEAVTQKPRERGPKRGAIRAVLFLIVAVIAAAGSALLLTRYLDARASAARVPTTKVVVAAVDLGAATTLRAESMTTVEWPTSSLPAGASSDPAGLVGRVAVSAISKGEPLLPSRIAAPEAGYGLAAMLPLGMRAIAVRVDDVVGVAGFVHPGDSVDVIVTMKPTDAGTAPPVSKIFLQNIRVLAVGKQVQRNAGKLDESIPATVATLMVDSEGAERLALAASKGQLLIALRSAADPEVTKTRGIVPQELLEGAGVPPPKPPEQRAAVVRRAAPAKPQAPAQPPPSKVVEILRGDSFEKRDFESRGGR